MPWFAFERGNRGRTRLRYPSPPPVTYIEQYHGTPTPDTQDWIVCPASGGTYPNVTECPGGWARVVENPAVN